jgi:hypothetical protein
MAQSGQRSTWKLLGPRAVLRWTLVALPVLAGFGLLAAAQADVVAEGQFDPNTGTIIRKVEVFGVTVYQSTSGFLEPDVITGALLVGLSAIGLVLSILLDSGDDTLDRLRWFFLLTWLGAGYLAADELFAIHETIGHNLQFLGGLPGHPDDLVLALYAVPTALFVLAFRDLIGASRLSLWLFAGGVGAYVLAVLVDFVEIEVDEQLEVIGALLIKVAFVVIAARLLVVRPRPG